MYTPGLIIQIIIALVFIFADIYLFYLPEKNKNSKYLIALVTAIVLGMGTMILSLVPVIPGSVAVILRKISIGFIILSSFRKIRLLRSYLKIREGVWIERILGFINIVLIAVTLLTSNAYTGDYVSDSAGNRTFIQGSSMVAVYLVVILDLAYSLALFIKSSLSRKFNEVIRTYGILILSLVFGLTLWALVIRGGADTGSVFFYESAFFTGSILYHSYREKIINFRMTDFPIKTKITLPLFFVTVFFVIISNILLMHKGVTAIDSEVSSKLELAVDSRKRHLDYVVEKKLERLRVSLNDPVLLKELSDFYNSPTENNKEIIREQVQNIEESGHDLDLVMIAEKDGTVLVSSESSFENTNISGEAYFAPDDWGYNLNFEPSDGIPEEIVLSGPIITENEITGIFVMKGSMQSIQDITLAEEGFDEGAEIYLIDMSGRLLTPIKNEPYVEEIDSTPAAGCFFDDGVEVNPEIYSNYSDDDVLGYYDQLTNVNWCLVAEIDEDVATANSRILLYELGLILIALFAIMQISINVVSGLITRPISNLIDEIKIVERGNFNHTVDTGTTDEIGKLSKAFDKVTKAVVKSRSEVQKKVEEQTRFLKESGEKLESQKSALLNLLEDIDEEKKEVKKTARELEKFKMAVENASDAVVITDADGIVLYVNNATEAITGFSKEEIIGKKAGTSELWGGRMELKFYERMWDTIKNKKARFSDEFENRRKSGAIYYAWANIAPILNENNDVQFIVAIQRDITKERQVDKAKTEFVSLASHQLRTPLSAIAWYAEMLLSGDVGKLNKEQKDFVEEIYNGNKRMVELVEALLNVSRIELGTFVVDPEPTDIKELSKGVVEEFKHVIEDKKLKFKENYGKKIPEMMVDPKLTRIIFQNLISNAVKYTSEEGDIDLSVKVVPKDTKVDGNKTSEDSLHVMVKDSGVGIPEHQQDKIFQKLFRADNVKESDTKGSGLGLYIVKSIVDHSGGEIWFKSKSSEGTIFHVLLPVKGMRKKEGTKALD